MDKKVELGLANAIMELQEIAREFDDFANELNRQVERGKLWIGLSFGATSTGTEPGTGRSPKRS